MHIYFESYIYKTDRIFSDLEGYVHHDSAKGTYETAYIGYVFVNTDNYSGPVFILPKAFLIDEGGGKMNVLGMTGIYPEAVIDTDDPDNPLELSGEGSFLPELGLWLYRALNRFREEHEDTKISEQALLDSQFPENGSRDKDFLSTALDLIDFLKDHRNLFTQISLINHSGHHKIDWAKTVQGDPFFKDGEAWYPDPAVKEKTIDIDDTLIVLYYSVLKYLQEKYKFPINLHEVPYQLLSQHEVQTLIDTGIGSKQMLRIRHRYFRDDLKHLWSLLDSFFTYNSTDEDHTRADEYLLVRNFQTVFEAMVDSIISDAHGIEDLKKQDDGKLVDHIFRYTSLIGNISDIYYIGDSKYYSDDNRPKGVALYKQFTYAKNAIQYHIDNYYLPSKGGWPPRGKGEIRYRDTLTEGYNITPNFFIRSRVTEEDLDFSTPSLKHSFWDKRKNQKNPPTNKHFEDRLFDRDTLILREFSINLLFVIASYAGYEDDCWSADLHRIIRNIFIEGIDEDYEFHTLTPKSVTPLSLKQLYMSELVGKTYMLDEGDNHLLVAFERPEKSATGKEDKERFLRQCLRNIDTGEEVTYDLSPTSLRELNEQ